VSLERYRGTAERIVEENGLIGQHGMGELILGIQEAIQGFVEHDLEWAAMAVENFMRENLLGLSGFAEKRLERVIDAIRERGHG